MKECRVCHHVWPDVFFGIKRGVDIHPKKRRSNICRRCAQKRRDRKKNDIYGRALIKADTTIAHHARKFIKDGIIESKNELTSIFGWERKRMARDMVNAFVNGVCECKRKFSEMPNGIRDVTVDIIDPRALPDYDLNVRLICTTCNIEKSDTSPAEWIIIRNCWKICREEETAGEWAGTLFEPLCETAQSELFQL